MADKPWYGSTIAEIERHGFSFQQSADYWGPTIPLSLAQINQIDDAYNNFIGMRDTLTVAKDTARGAQRDFDQAKKTLVAAMQKYSKVVRTSHSVTPEILEAFGMPIYQPASHPAPKIPTNLSATPAPGNAVALKWSRNGNIAGTQFRIERRIGSGSWELLTQITKTKFTDTTLALGTAAIYRVCAVRADESSLWSNEAAVYQSLAA